MTRVGVVLGNAVLGTGLVLASIPVVAPSIALCPSYPLTAWLAADRWAKPSFRWALAPVVAVVLGHLLYRRLRAPRGSSPGRVLLRWSLRGIALGLVYAWIMGSVDELVAVLTGPTPWPSDLPLLVSALVFAPLTLLQYAQALRCGGWASLALVAGGTVFGIANGVLARSAPAEPGGAPGLRARVRPSGHARWMLAVGALSGMLLFAAWAADHLRVVFYLIPLVVLAEHDMGSMASFAPDGSRILHVREPGDIYVMDADGSNPVRLTDTPPFELAPLRRPEDVATRLAVTLPLKRRPAYSPDGRSIVYVSDVSPIEADGGRLYVMDADGGRPRRLADGDPNLSGIDHPVFSPDGTRIACTIHGGRSIYLMDADGSNGTVVASFSGVGSLAFSPDGSLLAVETSFGTRGMAAGLYLIGLDGQPRASLGPSGTDPAFAPDGRRIVVGTTAADGRTAIEIIDRETSARQPILRTGFPGSEIHPRFSPDGSRIVFTSGPRHDRGVYIMNADGTSVRRVSPHFRGWFERIAPAILAGTGLALLILVVLHRRHPR